MAFFKLCMERQKSNVGYRIKPALGARVAARMIAIYVPTRHRLMKAVGRNKTSILLGINDVIS